MGAKAAALGRLAAAGLPVPPFVVLPDALRRAFLAHVPQPQDPATIAAAAWPPACREAVRQALIELEAASAAVEPGAVGPDAAAGSGPPAPLRLAVRSSMAGEDGPRWSFAGQLDSFLNVPADPEAGDSQLLAAIQACWASARGARAEAYRRLGASDPAVDPAMGVILQRMVDARAAGVLFTVDPVGGDRNTALLSVVPGLGERLVQGAEAGETLRLDRADGRALDPCGLLGAEEIAQLWRVALAAEHLGEGPQDLEFAFGAQGLALLQARPVTASAEAAPLAVAGAAPGGGGAATAGEDPLPTSAGSPTSEATADAETILWDNSNITESYAGVTTPLTLSLIRRAYAGVYRQFLRLMGVADPDEDVLQNLLGFYHGQVYYQLDRWYAALALLPAFRHNRGFLEQMMGVRQAAEGPARGAAYGRLHLVAWLVRLVRLHLGAARMTADFHRRVGAELAAVADTDLAALTPRGLQAVFRRLEAEVLGRWQAPILADFLTMIFFGLLRRLSERWLPDHPGIVGELMVAQGALASLEPLRQLEALAVLARERPELVALLRAPEPGAWARLGAQPAFATFHAACRDYLVRYGDRCANELKLEEPNLRDDPERLLRLVAAAAARPAGRAEGLASNAAAEARVDRLPWPRRHLYRWVLGHSRRYVAYREQQRLVRSRVFGQLRRLFGALGEGFARAGRLAEAGDIFYLTVDEVFAEVTGTAIALDLRALVRLRRAEYAGFRAESWPARFSTVGPPYWRAPRVPSPPDGRVPAPAAGAAGAPIRGLAGVRVGEVGRDGDGPPDLQGLGCCAGRVTGRVRVVERVDDALDLDGEILVAARTDPGWVFLFPGAAGLLVERGSPLSHSAIVARELGLPTIVNVPDLTDRLRTGDWVTMDGRGGGVWLHGG